MTECFLEPEFNFYQERRLEVKFSAEQLSTDGGILLARQAEEKVKIIKGMSERIADRRDPNRITHTMEQLVLQRVLQLANGYEDAVDCNQMRRSLKLPKNIELPKLSWAKVSNPVGKC